jgi:hypothetical protein
VGPWSMSPEALVFKLIWSNSTHSLMALAMGFAVAGLLSSGYQLLTLQQASFSVLHEGERNKALAAIPFLLFAAPFIIIRYILRGARVERGSFGFAMMAALVAGLWSLLSGTIVVMMLQAVGRIIA